MKRVAPAQRYMRDIREPFAIPPHPARLKTEFRRITPSRPDREDVV